MLQSELGDDNTVALLAAKEPWMSWCFHCSFISATSLPLLSPRLQGAVDPDYRN